MGKIKQSNKQKTNANTPVLILTYVCVDTYKFLYI